MSTGQLIASYQRMADDDRQTPASRDLARRRLAALAASIPKSGTENGMSRSAVPSRLGGADDR